MAPVVFTQLQQIKEELVGTYPDTGGGLGSSDLHWRVQCTSGRPIGHQEHTVNPLASEKIRTDSRIREIQALTPFN